MATGEETNGEVSATDYLFGRGNDALSGVIDYFKKAGNVSLQERVNESAARQNQMYRSTEVQRQNLGGTLPVGSGSSAPGVPGWVWAAGAVGLGALVLLVVKK